MHEIYIYMLLSFLTPMALFCLFLHFKKPFWSVVVYLPSLLYSVIKSVFFIGTYKGFFEEIEYFLNSDGIIIAYFMWIPSIIGFLLINILYFFIHQSKKNK